MMPVLDPNDRQFLKRLQRLGTGTVQNLCGEFGVTATAVRQRLGRLQAMQLVSRETLRAGRGRPAHVYRVTETGLRTLGDNYSELAQVLWRELGRITDPAIRARMFESIQAALVERYQRDVDGRSLADRLEQLRAALADQGFDVEVDSSGGLPILRENNCPYYDLASADSDICEMEQAVFRRVLGADVTLTQCCLDGHHCCEFQAVTADGK